MEEAGNPESATDAEMAGDGVESGVAVELKILAGVEDVEARDPEGDGGGEKEDARVEGAANRDPGGGGGDTERETEHQVRPAREAFRVRIKEHDCECDGREPQREAIQLGSGEDEDGAGNDDEGGHEGGREISGGECTCAGAGIGGVDGSVGESVEGHGGGAGGDHGDDDPEKLMGCGKAGGGEHGSTESEWEREDGVLPLDHFESDAKVAEDGHGSIVKQLAVSQWSVLTGALSASALIYAYLRELAGWRILWRQLQEGVQAFGYFPS